MTNPHNWQGEEVAPPKNLDRDQWIRLEALALSNQHNQGRCVDAEVLKTAVWFEHYIRTGSTEMPAAANIDLQGKPNAVPCAVCNTGVTTEYCTNCGASRPA